MEILLVITMFALFAWLIYNMAENRNRSGMAWAVCGVVLSPIIAILLLLLLGTPKVKESRSAKDLQ